MEYYKEMSAIEKEANTRRQQQNNRRYNVFTVVYTWGDIYMYLHMHRNVTIYPHFTLAKDSMLLDRKSEDGWNVCHTSIDSGSINSPKRRDNHGHRQTKTLPIYRLQFSTTLNLIWTMVKVYALKTEITFILLCSEHTPNALPSQCQSERQFKRHATDSSFAHRTPVISMSGRIRRGIGAHKHTCSNANTLSCVLKWTRLVFVSKYKTSPIYTCPKCVC